MTTHKSIFYQAQEQVCEALNEDEVLSGKVTFISENSKDIDYELKNALGRQGIVGIVMTPDATYQGITSEGEQVWDLKNFTVQVVENPIVNRGQPKYANITALDAAARATEILADPRFGLFGQYCPVTIEQGEDSGLIVAQAKFDVQIKANHKDTSKTRITYQDGTTAEYDIVGELTAGSIPNKSDIAEVEIGSHVTSLGNGAFYNCSGLTSVTIPDSVTSIGLEAFSECSGLMSVTIPDSVTNIGSYAFSYCERLTSVTIGSGVTSIGDYAFYQCSGLTRVTIPDGVTSIGWNAFSGCSGLTSVTIGSGVTSIGADAFNGCSGLTSVTIPASVTSIESYAFENCSGLTSVTFLGKTKATVKGMTYYSWELPSGCTIHCTDGDITI